MIAFVRSGFTSNEFDATRLTKKRTTDMWYLLYNVALLLASPVIVLILLGKKRCRRGLAQRLGRLPGIPGTDPVLWVHAVSLGEVVAAVPLIRAFHCRKPDYRIIVSTVTETGREAVEQRLGGIAEHRYAPLDFPWVVSKAITQLNPALVLIVETELWPNWLRALSRKRVPVVLVNGRLSSRSFRGYRLIRPLMRRVLDAVTLCLMQSERDVGRILGLGAQPSRVLCTGNIKFDQPELDTSEEHAPLTRAMLLSNEEELMVAGSTHPREEEELLAGYARLRERFPSLVLMLAPRHVERTPEVEATIRAAGFEAVRRSRLPSSVPQGAARVVILDTRGELAMVYRHAVLAFVGGTFVPVGGHNLLEPAVWAKPVLFGVHTDHCVEVADLLLKARGACRVANGTELAAEITRLLRDRPALLAMGRAAREVVVKNRGALERAVDLIFTVLSGQRESSATLNPEGTAMRSAFGTAQSLVVQHGMKWPLQLVAFAYGLAVRGRNALYQYGWLAQRRLPCRVVSVGNLTLGGTGKTPMVIWLAERLLASGARVGIFSRGYRRHSRARLLLVSDGRRVLATPAQAGDEPYLIAQRCPGAVVAVGADRYRLGRWILERFPLDYVVLDDGFQHRGVHRDVDLLLVDGSDPWNLQSLFPAGRLREPLSSARRATAVLVTRPDAGSHVGSVLTALSAAVGRTLDPILVRFEGEIYVEVLSGSVRKMVELSQEPAVIFSGIGNATSFRSLLIRQGVIIRDELIFPDHHAYTARDLDLVRARARRWSPAILITTEKDAVKIRPLMRPGDIIWAFRLKPDIVAGRDQLERLIEPAAR